MEQDYFIRAILSGDRAGVGKMHTAIFPAIRKLVRDFGGSEDDAKDVFQDATILIYEKAQRPDFQLTSQFSTFFIGISRNLWMSRRQKKSASEVSIPDHAKYIPDEIPESDLLQIARGNLLSKSMLLLGEDCQQVLQLFFQKTSMEDIARAMGFGSEGYAKRRKSQCKDRLVELIKSDPDFGTLYLN